MARQLNLRQIEAFKAVVEHGTVSRGAEVLNISQPAMSKLIAHLEADTGLKLFDRLKGRLAPTKRAMRLYEEISRIFAGIRQVESAVDAIRREDQGRLAIGVIPALSGSFIQQAISRFLSGHPNVFCAVDSVSSQWIVDRIIARQLDVGIVGAAIANPFVVIEPLMEHSLVCVLPKGHDLAGQDQIDARDLDGVDVIGLPPDFYASRMADQAFAERGVMPNIRVTADTMPILCEFVAAGEGVALVHPLAALGLRDRLVVRPFVPDIVSSFQLCRNPDSRNFQLIDAFTAELRATAELATAMIFT